MLTITMDEYVQFRKIKVPFMIHYWRIWEEKLKYFRKNPKCHFIDNIAKDKYFYG